MADTIQINVTRTWTQFPEAERFLFQNVSEHEIRVAVSTQEPTVRGHILLRGESMNRLSDGIHWHQSMEPTTAEFTAL